MVDAAARSALEQLLYPATGGVDGDGWPLGTMPKEADLMACWWNRRSCRSDEPRLPDVDATGAARAAAMFAADELAVLAPDRLVLSLTPVTP
jgi:hypothetical protein